MRVLHSVRESSKKAEEEEIPDDDERESKLI